MRYPAVLALGSWLIFFVGCGGGTTASTSTGGGGGIPSPTLTSIMPSSVNAGAIALTITLSGSNYTGNSTAEWNGSNLTTTYVNASTLTASVPASSLATAGNVQVTVTNSGGGGTSGSRTFTIAAVPTPGTWVRTVAGITNPQRMAWDSVHGKLYVSVASTDASYPNTVVPVDPVSGTAGTPVPAGNGSDLMSISSDSSYLWVGLDGDGAVQRFLLPSLTKDIKIPVPLSSSGQKQQAVSLEAARVSPRAVALVSGNGGGVHVFDDAIERPGFCCAGVNWIQWGANDSVIYGTSGGFHTLKVDSSGVTASDRVVSPNLAPGNTHYDASSGLLYWSSWAYDPVRNSQAGIFAGGAQGGIGLAGGCAAYGVNSALGRYYCILNRTYKNTELLVFDQKSYNLLGNYDLGMVIPSQPGQDDFLVPWGNAGLAVLDPSTTGNGALVLIDGIDVNPNAPPDSASGNPVLVSTASLATVNPQSVPAGSGDASITVTGSGFTQSSVVYSDYGNSKGLALPTTYVSPTQLTAVLPAAMMTSPAYNVITVWDNYAGQLSTNSLVLSVYANSGNTQVTGVNVEGLGIAWDPATSLLYVSTSFNDPLHPNSIVAVDPTTGTTTASAPVGAGPDLLDISSDHSHLFIGYAGATTEGEIRLPGLDSLITWPMVNPAGWGPFLANEVKAAPGSPATSAATLWNQYGSTPPAQGGVVVFDDNVARPDFVPGWLQVGNTGQEYDTIAWSNSDSLLAAATDTALGGSPLYALSVGSAGASYLATYPSFNKSGAPIHSDFGTGLIYSDDGQVASPLDGSIKGDYGASGLVVPDSSTNRVYILGQTQPQAGTYNYTIDSFNESTFAPVSSITVSLTGVPFRMVRWGVSGLAILVLNDWANPELGPENMLFLVKDSGFVSSARSSNAAPSFEPVKTRWNRITTRQIVERLYGAIPPGRGSSVR